MVSGAFQRAARSSPATWTEELLTSCSNEELESLSKLLGVARGGPKAKKIARLLDLGQLRVELQPFEQPEDLVGRYSRNQLHAMARRAGVYLGGNKRSLAASLLNWRNQCRSRGQEALAAARAAALIQPRQLRLPFD